MLHSPADVIRKALVDGGFGIAPITNNPTTQQTTPWQVYVAKEPHKPDNVITVYDEDGEDNGREMATSERQVLDGVQIRLRSTRSETGWVRVNQIAVGLDAMNMHFVVIGASTYRIWTFIRRGQPLFLGDMPDRDAVVYAINGVMSVRQLS